MHAPHHVMFTPVERVLAHLLELLVIVLGRDLLPRLVLLLPGLVAPVFLVPYLLVFVEGVFEIHVGLEMPFGHGNNLLSSGDLTPQCPFCLSQSYLHKADVMRAL
jgi:hypothetical protein